jgi:hypothetical protein
MRVEKMKMRGSENMEAQPPICREERQFHLSLPWHSGAYRLRKRQNDRYVRVLVGSPELDGLVAKGYLAPDARNDVEAIEVAISDLMFDCFTRPE